LSDVEIAIVYLPGRSARADKKRIEEDVVAIQALLLEASTHHADFCAFVGEGTFFTTSMDVEDNGKYLVTIGGRAHHT
jgi:hypothetical protein